MMKSEDELQEFYSRIHPMYGRWNANHEIHEWVVTPIHPGAGTSTYRCAKCGATKYTNGQTSSKCNN